MMTCKDSIIKNPSLTYSPKYISVYKFHLEWLYSVAELFMSHAFGRQEHKTAILEGKKNRMTTDTDSWEVHRLPSIMGQILSR